MVIICPILTATSTSDSRNANMNPAVFWVNNQNSKCKSDAPGFLSVRLWKGAQCRQSTMPTIRKLETIGIATKADFVLAIQIE